MKGYLVLFMYTSLLAGKGELYKNANHTFWEGFWRAGGGTEVNDLCTCMLTFLVAIFGHELASSAI